MLQVVQNYKTGRIGLEEVDIPALKPGGVIVRSVYSLISTGTEGAKVREAKMSYLQKARARPDQVRKVVETARQQGIATAFRKAMNRLDFLSPLGYSLSGIVEAVGADATEFEVGQRVACAGAGYANHAEFDFVPKNLVVPVPGGVSMEHAAFATIGAIALHALRQGELLLGESAVVVGLGLVGQMLVRLLKSAGARVFGIDVDPARAALARDSGAEAAGTPSTAGWRDAMMRATRDAGADCVFLTVGGRDNRPLQLAVDLVRDRGRIVAVGKTRLDLDYDRFFRKEVDVRFSRSYGPGRYDPEYEENGADYPIGYVRWTEQRNLSAFIDLVAGKKIDLTSLVSQIRPFAEAKDVYEELHAGILEGIGILFRFESAVPYVQEKHIAAATGARSPQVRERVRIGVIGAGNYATSMLLPQLSHRPDVELTAIATTTALSAANAKRKFGFKVSTTRAKDIFDEASINAVLIATRHRSHAALTAEALATGKIVFVEKPLAIDQASLAEVIEAAGRSDNRSLMVGFNRRHAPIMTALKAHLAGGPLSMVYRVHAGRLGDDSWLKDAAEGSRFIGEAGHFIDVFSYLTGAPAIAVTGFALRPASPHSDDLENISVTLRFEDGSLGTLLYLTQGGTATPKERLEVFGGGETFVMDNFAALERHTANGRIERLGRFGGDKGQRQEMLVFVGAALGRNPLPSSFDEIVNVTRATLTASQAALSGMSVGIGVAMARDTDAGANSGRAGVPAADGHSLAIGIAGS